MWAGDVSSLYLLGPCIDGVSFVPTCDCIVKCKLQKYHSLSSKSKTGFFFNFEPEYILAPIIVIWNSCKVSSEYCHWKRLSDISPEPYSLNFICKKNIFRFLVFLVMIQEISSRISACVDSWAHQPILCFISISYLSTIGRISLMHLPIYHGFLTAQVLEGLYQSVQLRSPGLRWKK